MKNENQMNYDTYRYCNFVKPPNSVGIVPERDREQRFLLFININIIIEMNKKEKKRERENTIE